MRSPPLSILRILPLVAASVAGFACDSERKLEADDYVEPDPPVPNGSDTGESGGSGAGVTTAGDSTEPSPVPEDTCLGSSACAEGQVCAAAFTGSRRGAFGCEASCVASSDPERWCSDAASCCDAGASCTARGLCVGSAETGTTG